ncbi:aspartyl-phosphate phosphatase Spo0E family protein [Paenibacillus sp. FSL A5-0031]|uniref:aspartyl-phosphate phosphatase Spo0E family protein n=1 Tax=Paenibacillus sp. FSL A5-0031 TaxID=1920420 RepID=UPI0035576DD6
MNRDTVLHKIKLEQTIELLRQEMIDKLLVCQSYQADEVLGASRALDLVLNCYDCVRFERGCMNEENCASRALLDDDSSI